MNFLMYLTRVAWPVWLLCSCPRAGRASSLPDLIALTASEWVYKNFSNELEALSNPPPNIRSGNIEVFFIVRQFFVAKSSSIQLAQKALLTANLVNCMTACYAQASISVLAFRGTVDLQDWIYNMGVAPSTVPFERIGLGVHSGWYAMTTNHLDSSLTSCLDDMPAYQCALVQALDDEAKRGATSLLFTGHSLGGAQAQIAAMLVLQTLMFTSQTSMIPAVVLKLMETVMCVTFGSPTPFNLPSEDALTPQQKTAQTQALQKAEDRLQNYIQNNDPVPRVPGELDFVQAMMERVQLKLVVGCSAYGIPMLRNIDPCKELMETRKKLPILEQYASITKVTRIGYEGLDQNLRGTRAKRALKDPRDPDPVSVAKVNPFIKFAGGTLPAAAIEDHDLDMYYQYFPLSFELVAPSPILLGHTSGVLSVAADFQFGKAISGSYDRSLKVWDLLTGQCERTLTGHTGGVLSVAADFQLGKAISSGDDSLKVWDLLTGQCERTLTGHTGFAIISVAADFQFGKAISASHDYSLKVWDLLTGQCERTLTGHTSGLSSVAADFQLGKAISASHDSSLKVWDLLTGQCERTLTGHTGQVLSVAADFQLGKAISASYDRSLKVWDLLTGQCERTLTGHTDWVWSVAADFQLGKAISASHDFSLKVWDLLTGQCERTALLTGHTGGVLSVAADFQLGKAIYFASDDDSLKVWDFNDVVQRTNLGRPHRSGKGRGSRVPLSFNWRNMFGRWREDRGSHVRR